MSSPGTHAILKMECCRASIAVIGNSWNSVRFDHKEKFYLRKNCFTMNTNNRKQRKNYHKHSNRSKKSLNLNPCIHSQSWNSEKKRFFEEKFSFLTQSYFVETLILSISSRFSGNLLVLQQEIPCIHRFDMIIFYKFTNFGVTSGTCINKFGFLAISTSWHKRKKV